MSYKLSQMRIHAAITAVLLCFCFAVTAYAAYDDSYIGGGTTTVWASDVTLDSGEVVQKNNSTTVELRSNVLIGAMPRKNQNVVLTATARTSNPHAVLTTAIWYLDGVEAARFALNGENSSEYAFRYNGEAEASCVFSGLVASETPIRDTGAFETEPTRLLFTESSTFVWQSEPMDTYANASDDAVTLYAVGVYNDDIAYQWYWDRHDGNAAFAIPNATHPTLEISAVAARNGQSWYCVATDTTGARHTSRSATLTVYSAPSITWPKPSVYVLPNETATLTPVIGNDSGIELIRWQVSSNNGVTWRDLNNNGKTTLTVQGFPANDKYQYRVWVSNSQMDAESEPVVVRVASAPSVYVTVDKQGAVLDGTTVTFMAHAERNIGPEAVTYQWYVGDTPEFENAVAIDGATKSYYERETTLTDDGKYVFCLVYNGAIYAVSDAYRLSIEALPPVFEVTGNSTYWVNEPVTLTIEHDDRYPIALAAKPFSWDGGETWTNNPRAIAQANGTYNVCVKDVDGRITQGTVSVEYIDTDTPSVERLVLSNDGWTNRPVSVKAERVVDGTSGFPSMAFNWNGEGWCADSEYLTTENSVVTLVVRDKAGNQSEEYSIDVSQIDLTEPRVLSITGIPLEWTNQPIDVLAYAEDGESGLPHEAYSWDDGATWTSAPFHTFREQCIAALRVRDVAGNETYYPFYVTNVDATPPEISVSYEAMSNDMKYVFVKLYATDNEPNPVTEFCFGYNEAAGDANVFSEVTERAVLAGETITVAARDWLGNIGTLEITPTVYDLTAKTLNTELIAETAAGCDGWTFGGLNASGNGYYLDAAGIAHAYQDYKVNGRTIRGVALNVTAKPLGGGYLSGTATVSGMELPIYWDDALTQTVTDTEATGTIIVPASAFVTSTRNAVFIINVSEYADSDLAHELNHDSVAGAVNIDAAAPAVSLTYSSTEKTVRATVTDAISGVRDVKYKVSTDAGETEWLDYIEPIPLTTTSKVTVAASDRVGNVTYASSDSIAVTSGVKQSSNDSYATSYRYRTAMFDHYLIGTGKVSLSSARR